MFIARIFGPESFGRVKGMVYLVMLPASLGAVIAAAIYDASGSYRMAWIVVLVLLTPAAFLIRRISPEGAPVASPAEAAPAAATPRAADA